MANDLIQNTSSHNDKGVSHTLQQKLILLSVAAIIAIVTFFVFLPSLNGEFLIWDDNLLVAENRYIQSIDLEFFKWAFTDVAIAAWYPVTVTSFAIDYAFWGNDPYGYHLTNNIFHAFNAFLVFILASCLVSLGSRDKKNGFTLQLVAASVTAVLFSIHPLRVESVAWTAERKDVLYAFFYILSILSYLKYASVTARKTRYYIGSLILFTFSLMSKSMAVTLPVILLVLDYYPLKRILPVEGRADYRKILLEKVPFIGLSLIVSAIALMTHHDTGALMGLESHPLTVRFLVAIKGYIFYLYKMLVPTALAPYYPYPHKITIISLEYLGSLLLFFAFTAASVFFIRKKKVISAVWLFYVLTLLPVIGIAQTGSFSAANRYTYLPCLGPLLIVGLAAGSIFVRSNLKMVRVIILALFLTLSAILINSTIKEIPVWKDTESLWSRQIELHPDRIPLAYLNRGVVRYERRELDSAISDYSKAIELDPKHAKAYSNRANAYEIMGNLGQALEDFTIAIKLSPELAGVYSNRGNIFLKMKRFEDAIKDYNMAIDIDPDYAKAYSNRGATYGGMGEYEKAIKDYDRSIELAPWNAKTYNNRGYTYAAIGNYSKALEDYSKTIELEPGYSRVYNNRAATYRNMGNFESAANDYRTVIKITPESSTAYFYLALCYEKIGMVEESFENMKKSAKLGNSNAKKYLEGRGSTKP